MLPSALFMELPFAPMHFNIHGQELLSCTRNLLLSVAAESFFHTLKVEEVYGQTYETRHEAKSSIFEYIEIFYNHKRRHSYLGLVIPMDFEYKNNQKPYENAAWLCVYKKQERSPLSLFRI